MLKTILFVLFSIAIASTIPVFAQSDTGTPSFTPTFQINDYESVDLASLNILIQAPVRAKGGPVSTNMMLTLNSQIFAIKTGQQTYAYSSTANAGTVIAFGYWPGRLIFSVSSGLCPNQTATSVYTIRGIGDGNGTNHLTPTMLWDSQGCIYTTNYDVVTVDHSGLEVVIPHGNGGTYPNVTVYDRAGNASTVNGTGVGGWQPQSGTVTDPHGNTLTPSEASGIVSFTDQLDTITPIVSYTPSTAGPTAFTYTDGTSVSQSVTPAYYSTTFLPAFSCSGIFNQPNRDSSFLKSVTYADGSILNLTWETTSAGNNDGRLSTLQVPTGATYAHSYRDGTNNDGLWCATGKVGMATLSITNGAGTWLFVRTNPFVYNMPTFTTTVTKPDGSKIQYAFSENPDGSDEVTQMVTYDTDGSTVLDTWTYCYDSTISSCNSSAPTQHPTWVRAYHTVPGVASNAEVDTKYDTYGNVLEVDRYDFGPTLVNKTLITYGNWNGSSCASLSSAHIESAVCDVQTQDSGSNILTHSRFNRNASTGDLLNKYDYYSSTGYLTSTYTYNSNGTMATATRPDGFQTTFGNSQCNGYLPDHATTSIGTASMTWDCNLAAPATTTALNGLVTYYTRADSLNRVTEVSDSGGQNPLTYTYTSPTQMSVDMTVETSRLVDTTTTLNSLGQVISVQHQQYVGSPNYDTVSYGYDTTGHKTTVSQACSTTLGATCAPTASSTTYDGMNRPKVVTINSATNGTMTYTYPDGDVNVVLGPAPSGEHTKIVQQEYDGLGRLASSCAVWTTGGNGSGNCNQRNSGSGYLTKYTLDGLGRATQISRNAQGTAVNTTAQYDMLSRVTQSVIPESGTSYFYFDASNSPCTGGLAGHVNKSIDPAGNVACSWYDTSTKRLNKITFPSGPNSSNTPTRTFAYDSNPLGGANLVGRLARASTCTGSCTSNITDEQFGFDVYGRQSDHWQNSPSLGSGNYFHTTASYFPNGALYSLSGIPGSLAVIYDVDGEGRPYNAVLSGGSNLVSGVTYDNASRPTEIDYSNGDKDNYSYDLASGSMTQFQFTVGASNKTDTGVLNWNGDGTLFYFSRTDQVSGGSDNETCYTNHDDLVRFTSWGCMQGSTVLFNEGYSYSNDYAGNITKSGTLNFAPGYTASNNHFLSPYTYDSDGNILYDATLGQSYTWDSVGSMVTAGTASVVNDAFGRPVEKTVGSTTTQVLYSPVGKLGTTTGLAGQLSLKLPMPGGSSMTWDNTSHLSINHKDWMGNVRLVTDNASRGFDAAYCYGPFGEVYCGTPSSSQFEGKSQDTSTGLFDYDAVRYSGTWGRWVSPQGGVNGYVKNNSPF